MQTVRAIDARDRLLLLYVGGSLFLREGNTRAAKSQFRDALSALAEDSRANSADASAIWVQLGCLYLQERRYADASAALEHAFSTLDRATDATPLNRIKLLNARAALWGRLKRWQDAETDLIQAVSLCRGLQSIDSSEIRPILTNYAYVLRKMHRKQARSVEKLALRAKPASNQVIDLSELLATR